MTTAAAAAVAALTVRDATRLFGSARGLRGVSLSLRAGEIYALLGPNGAGKTSLVRAICGRLRLEAGSVVFAGGEQAGSLAARRALGLVPQRIALHADLTVRENLALFGRLAGLPSRDVRARVDEALDRAGLASRADDLLRTLSGGMQRRLNLVAGILHRPRVLLLDEPTVGVDPDARLRVHALLEHLRDSGMAVLLTTHDLDEAERLSDRIGFLVDGRLEAEGTLDRLVADTLGMARHLEVVLASAPDAAAAGGLRALDLQPSQDTARWLGKREGDVSTLGPIERSVRDLGLSVRQMTLVEPGLREVFLHLTGRELDA